MRLVIVVKETAVEDYSFQKKLTCTYTTDFLLIMAISHDLTKKVDVLHESLQTIYVSLRLIYPIVSGSWF